MLITHKTSVRSRSNKRESITDKAPTEATIYLYGDIGGWFGIDHQEWIKEFNALTADTIHLRVDSSGGDIFAAKRSMWHPRTGEELPYDVPQFFKRCKELAEAPDVV